MRNILLGHNIGGILSRGSIGVNWPKVVLASGRTECGTRRVLRMVLDNYAWGAVEVRWGWKMIGTLGSAAEIDAI